MATRPRLNTLRPRVSTINTSLVPADERGTAHERGYDYRWQKARARYLHEHPCCVMCNLEGRVIQATVVDHVIPHRGDQHLFWDETNWQSLCVHHHSSVKQRQENRGET